MLEISGYDVVVTRDTDTSIHDKGIEGIAQQKSSDMDNRLAIFNDNDNAVCILIHQNQFTQPQYHGAQMFYSATNPEEAALLSTDDYQAKVAFTIFSGISEFIASA